MKYAIPVAVVLTLALGGCSSDIRGLGDAPAGPFDDGPARIVNFPNGFANVAFKCMGRTGIYSSTREAPPVVIPNDPGCPPS